MTPPSRTTIPAPASVGVLLTYRCTSACRHCMYACSPEWDADWMPSDRLREVLETLAPTLLPSARGADRVCINFGLHFTGGEPFLDFERLLEAVSIASELEIPSIFVETNAYWCADDGITLQRYQRLKVAGLHGILVSVNPFSLEHVPFERTERAIRLALALFQGNTMVYQVQYLRQFAQWNLSGRLPLAKYLARVNPEVLLREVELLTMGRAPYGLQDLLRPLVPFLPAEEVAARPCDPPLLRPLHNHVDNYGSLIPGYCSGLRLGDVRDLPQILRDGLDVSDKPVLRHLLSGDLPGLLRYARARGYEDREDGYLSNCHLCVDLRRHLAGQEDLPELQPRAFYDQLDAGP